MSLGAIWAGSRVRMLCFSAEIARAWTPALPPVYHLSEQEAARRGPRSGDRRYILVIAHSQSYTKRSLSPDARFASARDVPCVLRRDSMTAFAEARNADS